MNLRKSLKINFSSEQSKLALSASSRTKQNLSSSHPQKLRILRHHSTSPSLLYTPSPFLDHKKWSKHQTQLFTKSTIIDLEMLFKSQLAMVRIDYKSELFDKKLMSWGGEWQTLKWLAFYKTSEETNSWGVYNNFACLRVSPYAAMSSASARPWSFFLWSCELSRGNNSDATRLLSSCNNKILGFQIRLILNHKNFHNFF